MEDKKYAGLLLASGGVDSSVAAALIKDRHPLVATLLMKTCDTQQSPHVRRAAEMANSFGLDHICIDVKEAFGQHVAGHFVAEYGCGHTPSPCADCNREIKFGSAIDAVRHLLVPDWFVATGHYARTHAVDGTHFIRIAADTKKDQSYFLCDLSKSLVPRLVFPLGGMEKPHVRAVAVQLGIAAAATPDSMDLCFVEGDYRAMLPPECTVPGAVVDTDGRTVGTHRGLGHYTYGQRKGFTVSLKNPVPMYVCGINTYKNELIVDVKERVMTKVIKAYRMNLFTELGKCYNLLCRYRSTGCYLKCKILRCDDDFTVVELDYPVVAPAPGQRLAIYGEDGVLLAGGTIYGREDEDI